MFIAVTAMENVAVSWIIKHGRWSQVILKRRKDLHTIALFRPPAWMFLAGENKQRKAASVIQDTKENIVKHLRCPASTFWKLETLKEMGSTGSSLKKKEVLQKYFVTWQLTEVSTVNNSFLQFWLCVDEQGCRGKPCSLVFEPEGEKILKNN